MHTCAYRLCRDAAGTVTTHDVGAVPPRTIARVCSVVILVVSAGDGRDLHPTGHGTGREAAGLCRPPPHGRRVKLT